MKKFAIFLIILIILAAATGGYYFLKTQKTKEKVSQPPPETSQEFSKESAQKTEQKIEPASQEKTMAEKKELILTSPSFGHMENIPVRYACDGQKINPSLEISGVADNAKSLVLIMEDPDVPKNVRADGMWNHWLKFNLPPSLSKIEEGKDPGGLSGLNTSKNLKYIPPCPPDKEHRYFFKLYSLDVMLDLKQGATKEEILAALENHILQQAVLVGLYERQ